MSFTGLTSEGAVGGGSGGAEGGEGWGFGLEWQLEILREWGCLLLRGK